MDNEGTMDENGVCSPREDSKWTLWLQEVDRPDHTMSLGVPGFMTARKVAKRYEPQWRIISICRKPLEARASSPSALAGAD